MKKDTFTAYELQIYNRGIYREYLRYHNDLTSEEKKLLLDWSDQGNSVHSNPWGITDRSTGYATDFIDAYRLIAPKK